MEDLGPGSKLRENAITDGGCAALATALRGGALPALRPLPPPEGLPYTRVHSCLHPMSMSMCTGLHIGTASRRGCIGTASVCTARVHYAWTLHLDCTSELHAQVQMHGTAARGLTGY